MLSEREKLTVLINNEPLKKSEAVILLEGDGFSRLSYSAKLYQEHWAPKIVISGGISNESYGSFPAKKLLVKLIELGVPEKDIFLEEASQNTAEQARNIISLAKQNNWKRIILVASHYHQLRAFLTFLKALKDSKIDLEIINSPTRDLSWFEQNPWGKRIELLESEYEKIEKYKDDVASFAEGIAYQQQKEAQK